MDNKSKIVIKEVIEDILVLRSKKIEADVLDDTSFFYPNEESQNDRKERINYRQERTVKEFDIPLIKLNNLLEKKDKYEEVLEIEKEMTRLQTKKIISVKEFIAIYGYSSDWQKNRRGRIHDHLPYIQTTSGGKITYNVRDIETWFDNNNISR